MILSRVFFALFMFLVGVRGLHWLTVPRGLLYGVAMIGAVFWLFEGLNVKKFHWFKHQTPDVIVGNKTPEDKPLPKE